MTKFNIAIFAFLLGAITADSTRPSCISKFWLTYTPPIMTDISEHDLELMRIHRMMTKGMP